MKEAKTLIMDGLLLKCFVWLNVEPLFIFFSIEYMLHVTFYLFHIGNLDKLRWGDERMNDCNNNKIKGEAFFSSNYIFTI